MKKLVFDTGKDIVTFRVNGTTLYIKNEADGVEACFNPVTFEDQKKSKKAMMILRRKKGEKWFGEWRRDYDKYMGFSSEEDIIEDIMADFHKAKGWRLLSE